MTDISVTHGGQQTSAQREIKPHKWALSPWARTFRRIARPLTVASHVRKFCRPFTIDGRENLANLENPLLIIANHTSHFDTVIVLSLLPNSIYDRTAVVAAADRMYRERIKGAWHSLRYNAFPITRGGDDGRAVVDGVWQERKDDHGIEVAGVVGDDEKGVLEVRKVLATIDGEGAAELAHVACDRQGPRDATKCPGPGTERPLVGLDLPLSRSLLSAVGDGNIGHGQPPCGRA